MRRELGLLAVMVMAGCSSGGGSGTDTGHDQAETSVSNATKLCAAIDKTGMASEPCSVSGWSSSIALRMDLQSGQGQVICDQTVAAAHAKGLVFGPGWKVQVLTPSSGDHPAATCSL